MHGVVKTDVRRQLGRLPFTSISAYREPRRHPALTVVLDQKLPLDNGTFSNRTHIFTEEGARAMQLEERALLVLERRIWLCKTSR